MRSLPPSNPTNLNFTPKLNSAASHALSPTTPRKGRNTRVRTHFNSTDCMMCLERFGPGNASRRRLNSLPLRLSYYGLGSGCLRHTKALHGMVDGSKFEKLPFSDPAASGAGNGKKGKPKSVP